MLPGKHYGKTDAIFFNAIPCVLYGEDAGTYLAFEKDDIVDKIVTLCKASSFRGI